MSTAATSTPALPRRLAGDPLLAGALGGAVIALIELIAIGVVRPSVSMPLLAVFAGTGAIAGAIALATGAIVRRLGWAGPGAALIHALPSLAIWIPVCGTLFEGSFAATLPGAGVAPYLLPLVLVLLVAAAAWIAAWWRSRPRRFRDPVLAALLVAVLAVLWFANRRMFRSGYADLHTGLTLCEIVLAGLIARVAGDGALPGKARAGVAAVVLGSLVAALLLGLSAAEDRRVVATRGDDTRHLVRLWRSLIDIDGDGTSAMLGGGDCDDGDATRHPGARDLPGNGRDEDCDGADAIPRKPSPQAAAQARSTAEWRAQADVGAKLAATRDLNVLVVSIDALRYDQLAPDAPGRRDFPNLTSLLDQSVWFQRALAPASGTDVSLSSFVTGRWNPFQPIPTTLIEAMQASGRTTGVIFPREVLRYCPEPLLTRGADSVERVITDGTKRDIGDRITASTTTDHALEFLKGAGDKGYFLWAHYFDAHEHLQINVPPVLVSSLSNRGATPKARNYRALLRAIDTEVGRLLDAVKASGLADRTIVVLFADHGESLGEDPRLPDNHGLVVYEALTRVPFAIKIPNLPGHADLEPVSLVDLAPTLLTLLGIAPLDAVDGVDLLPSLLSAPEPLRHHDRALVLNENDQWGVVEWPWKLMVRPKDNLVELYDLDADPTEQTDLAAGNDDKVRELRSRYGEFPTVPLDRTKAGRRWREAQAQPPTAREP